MTAATTGSPEERRRAIEAVAAYGIGTALLLWPAFWNGLPFVTPDTDRYLSFHLAPHHPPFYQAIAATLGLTRSLWPVAIVQAVLVVAMLRALCSRLLPGHAHAFWLLLLPLAAFSSLPWVTSRVLADLMTPLMLLALFLLVVEPATRSRRSGLWLSVFFVYAVVCHGSHVAIALPLLVSFAALVALVVRAGLPLRCEWRRAVALLAVAAAILTATNSLAFGRVTPSFGGSVILLARLIQDGPGTRTLKRSCAAGEDLLLCREVARLPMASERFLWFPRGSVGRLGFLPIAAEAPGVVWQTVRAEPFTVLSGTLANGIEQVGLYDVGGGFGGLNRMHGIRGRIASRLDHDLGETRQSRGTLRLDVIRAVHRVALLASLAGMCALCVVAWRRRDAGFLAFGAFALLAVLVNALVTGGLAIPYVRYGARVAWLVPLAACIGVLRLTGAAERATGGSGQESA